MNRIFFVSIVLLTGMISCDKKERNSELEQIVSSYYQVYQRRSNFDQFLEFYDDEIILVDYISGDKKMGKDAFATFFDWGNPDFSLVDSTSMIIENQVISGSTAVTSGYFTPFMWGEYQFGAMYFTTVLTFNVSGKISKQEDWINYPNNLLDYQKRKNSNDWISK